jgi:hypothetical protein
VYSAAPTMVPVTAMHARIIKRMNMVRTFLVFSCLAGKQPECVTRECAGTTKSPDVALNTSWKVRGGAAWRTRAIGAGRVR